jgi:hypothetical protein
MRAEGTNGAGERETQIPKIGILGDFGTDHIIISNKEMDSSNPHEITRTSFDVKVGVGLIHNLLRYPFCTRDKAIKEWRRIWENNGYAHYVPGSRNLYNSTPYWETFSEYRIKNKVTGENDWHWLEQTSYQFALKTQNPNAQSPAFNFRNYYKMLIIRDVYLNADAFTSNDAANGIYSGIYTIMHGNTPWIVLRTTLTGNSGNGQFQFKNPRFIDACTDKTQKKQLMQKTILLLTFDELNTSGAMLQGLLSWDGVLKGSVQTIRQITDYRNYYAIVIAHHTLGALLFVPWLDDDGLFSLIYFEDQIEKLSKMSSKPGILFGNLTILQTAIAMSIVKNSPSEYMFENDDKTKDLETLEVALQAGLYASYMITEAGPFLARKESTCPVAEVDFPIKTTWTSITEILLADQQATQLTEDKKKHLPTIRQFKGNSFGYPCDDRKIDREISYAAFSAVALKRKPTCEPYPFESILKESIFQKAYSNPHDRKNDLCLDVQSHLKAYSYESLLAQGGVINKLCQGIVTNGKIQNIDDPSDDLLYSTHTNQWLLPRASIPYLRIGKHMTYDSSEIHQICETYDLFHSYWSHIKQTEPVSMCVFGAPGSGKSFLAKQFVERLKGNWGSDGGKEQGLLKPKYLGYNLSQMKPKGLVKAFHEVRDAGLDGRLPFVFFDEFDTPTDDKTLGWLKYFLAPMNDGEFLDSLGSSHKIGRAVFIFAGGVFYTMNDFRHAREKVGKEPYTACPEDKCDFSKHPDFLSRLKGYIDIAGPNGTKTDGDTDLKGLLHFFRRATLLRTMLEDVRGIFPDDKIDIDEEVVTAFLRADKYYNGVRSMRGIIDLSNCATNEKIKATDIYIGDRLGLFVDPSFEEYLQGNRR